MAVAEAVVEGVAVGAKLAGLNGSRCAENTELERLRERPRRRNGAASPLEAFGV